MTSSDIQDIVSVDFEDILTIYYKPVAGGFGSNIASTWKS